MLGGVHFFLCFPCSVALRFSTFATPLRQECEFLIHPSCGAAVLCPPILQHRLLCGALFSNTWGAPRSKRNARISREVFNKSEMTLPCCVALTFFCASHARWRCEF